MADNIVTLPGHCIATDEIAGCHHLRTKLTFGADGAFADVSSSNPLPISIISGGQSGGLTDAQLRAAPVPVSGTVSVTGPLTDTQLRASPLGVAGAFYQATQPVSIAATVAISAATLPLPSGAATETTLAVVNTKTPALGQAAMAASSPVVIASNQSAVPISGTVTANINGTVPVSGTFWQATQPVSGTFWQVTQPVSVAATLATRDLKDSGRAIVNAATAIAGITAVTSEALMALNVSRDGANVASVTTIAVTSGKKLRILGYSAGIISTAAAVISARVSLRINPTGAVAANSPIIHTLCLSQKAAALAQAGSENAIMFPEAVEISGAMQIGLSHIASVTTGTVWASLIAYEY